MKLFGLWLQLLYTFIGSIKGLRGLLQLLLFQGQELHIIDKICPLLLIIEGKRSKNRIDKKDKTKRKRKKKCTHNLLSFNQHGSGCWVACYQENMVNICTYPNIKYWKMYINKLFNPYPVPPLLKGSTS